MRCARLAATLLLAGGVPCAAKPQPGQAAPPTTTPAATADLAHAPAEALLKAYGQLAALEGSDQYAVAAVSDRRLLGAPFQGRRRAPVQTSGLPNIVLTSIVEPDRADSECQ